MWGFNPKALRAPFCGVLMILNSSPNFWTFPLHLGRWNLPFYFFPNYFLLKLEYTKTFISTIKIFIQWKNEFTKYSSRIDSIIEIFCTFLNAWCIWVCSTYLLPLRFGTHDVHWNGAKAQSCVVQKFCTKGGQTLLSLPGTREIKLFFPLQKERPKLREE
jgi:hypothetical protein